MYHPNLPFHQKHGLIAALLILALLAPLGEALQAQDLVWAKRAGGSSSSAGGYGIALDGTGNSYVTGYFQGSVTFGPSEANTMTLTTTGSSDIFIAKYDVNGTLVWARRAGGSSSDIGLGIAVDGSGNSYVTGEFDGSATFGPGEANETILFGTDGDIFVTKYDGNGALVWAKSAGGSFFDVGNGIAVDGAGNSYITGHFRNSATFGPGDANETILFGTDRDIFVAKYDANGVLVWTKRAGGSSSNDFGFGIAVDGTGNSYVTGAFDGAATFGPGEANETTLSGTNLEIFVTKYDANGALTWARRAGGMEYDIGRGIAVDGAGNSYVTGKFESSAIFGAGEANQTTLSGADTALFVAKYNANGALEWAKGAGGSKIKEGLGIAVDGAGNSYVTGHFLGSSIFGPGEANETTLTSAGYWDIFVAKHNGSGALLWAKRAGGTYDDQGFGIAVDETGNSYVTGQFSGSATFGSGEANETTLISAGYSEIFVAKFRAATTLQVTIDIRPGVTPNTIKPDSKGIIDVAILTTPTFNALTVDPLSVRFGPNQATEVHGKGHFLDVDGDGDLDMVLHFKILDTGIQCGDTQASLTGQTLGGQSIVGTDAIQTVGCSSPKAVAEAEAGIPGEYTLFQNSPNPFNPTTTIQFAVPRESYVRLKVYNSFGAEVATLVDRQVAAGTYKVNWDASRLASGFYLYRLEAEGFARTKKLLLMK